MTTYHGIFRDDGLVVFTGRKSAREVKDWLEEFQQTVNKAAVNQHLQFTAKICITKEKFPTPAKEERFQIVKKDKLPFQDVKMSWSPEVDLKSGMFSKQGQQLKYFSKEISHTPVPYVRSLQES